jgi:hypothetical protein
VAVARTVLAARALRGLQAVLSKRVEKRVRLIVSDALGKEIDALHQEARVRAKHGHDGPGGRKPEDYRAAADLLSEMRRGVQ